MIFAFLVPIITCLILFLFFRKETVWFEYFIVFVPSILGTLLSYYIIGKTMAIDYKYISEPAVKIRHYDKWNEWVHRTCTRTIRVGKTTRTQTYDCSYCKTHPEKWAMIDKKGNEYWISEDVFNYYRNLWGTKEIFINCHRSYYTIDGDAQDYMWNNKPEHILVDTRKELYKNYFQTAPNLYNIEDLTSQELKDNYLIEKDKIKYFIGNKIKTGNYLEILGYKVTDNQVRKQHYLNSRDKNFRTIFLFFDNKNPSIAEKHAQYWKRGEENEVVFCFGIKNDTVTWIRSFSWSEEPWLESEFKSTILPGKRVNIDQYQDLIDKLYLEGKWRPKDFKSFSYISPVLTTGGNLGVIFITLLINILISIWVIDNEIRKEE